MADLTEFNEALRKKNLRGFWESYQGGEAYREPASSFEPHLWKWADVYEAIQQASEKIGLEQSPRRVIQLRNPSLKASAAHTFVLNFQSLKPGEHAVTHRHTNGAIRFVIQGKGARMVVEGEAFEIAEGDFITTPNWTWHDHINETVETMIWLDGLDSPLVRMLEVGFHEPHAGFTQPISRPEGSSLYELSPIRPSWVRPGPLQPPAYCYKWEETAKVLKAVGERPGDPCDGILLEYVNPVTGGPTLPTLSCGIQLLRPGERTQSHRHTSSAIYHVFRGQGATIIDDRRFQWEAGDSFVVPLWRFHAHENLSDREAILFVMTDKPAMDALGFYREERRS